METDRDRKWALFENRPARERTAILTDQGADPWPERAEQAAPRGRSTASELECIKC